MLSTFKCSFKCSNVQMMVIPNIKMYVIYSRGALKHFFFCFVITKRGRLLTSYILITKLSYYPSSCNHTFTIGPFYLHLHYNLSKRKIHHHYSSLFSKQSEKNAILERERQRSYLSSRCSRTIEGRVRHNLHQIFLVQHRTGK